MTRKTKKKYYRFNASASNVLSLLVKTKGKANPNQKKTHSQTHTNVVTCLWKIYYTHSAYNI